MRPYVRNMQYSIWANGTATYSMVANSVWDVLNVSFVKLIDDDGIEKEFDRQLEADNLSYTLSRSVWDGVVRREKKKATQTVNS